MQYLEDMKVGTKASFGRYEVTREEVLEFAGKYDPQPFHLDDEAAAKTHFGRISASGWHTCAMTMAMLVENLKKNQQAGLGSPGLDELRGPKPVYPGDSLRAESQVLDRRISDSHKGFGIVTWHTRGHDQNDALVIDFKRTNLVRLRNA